MGQRHRAGLGGIARLDALLDEHWECVEADLWWRYRRDLRDLLDGSLTYPQWGVMVEGLPMESPTQTAMFEALTPQERASLPRGDGEGRKSREARILEAVRYYLEVLVWQRTEDGHANRNAPTPPGITAPVMPPEEVARRRKFMQQVYEARGGVPEWQA